MVLVLFNHILGSGNNRLSPLGLGAGHLIVFVRKFLGAPGSVGLKVGLFN